MEDGYKESLWTVRDLERYLRVSRSTIYRMVRKGLPAKRIGHAFRFDRTEIYTFLQRQSSIS